jgi:hypothetical protein
LSIPGGSSTESGPVPGVYPQKPEIIAGEDFLNDFYRHVTVEAGIRPLFDELPEGVTAQIRNNGEKDFVFAI